MSIIRDFARFIEPSGELSYDNTTSGLSGTTIKSAIDELSVLVGGGNVGSQATFDLYEFTATGGQTIFNLSETFTEGNTITTGNFVTGVVYKITNVGDTDFTLIGAASNTLGEVFTATGPGGGTTGTAEVSITYVPGYIQVYVNGVFVAENDYTASDGQTIVLSESADASDLISLVVLDSFNTATQLRVIDVDASAPDDSLVIDNVGDVSVTSDIKLADNGKAIFGAGSDLQIYHTGGASVIADSGDGSLFIQGESQIVLGNVGNIESYAIFNTDGAVQLRHNNTQKFTTTSSGIDVTGTVTADALTVSSSTPTLQFTDTDNNYDATIQGLSGSLVLTADSGAEFGTESIQFKTGAAERMRIDSAGNVTIGAPVNNDADAQLHVYGLGQTTADLTDSGDMGATLRLSDVNTAAGSGGAIVFANQQGDVANSAGFAAIKGLLSNGNTNTIGHIAFSTRDAIGDTALTERMRIDSSGNTSIYETLTLGNTDATTGDIRIYDTGNNQLQLSGIGSNDFLVDLLGTSAVGTLKFNDYYVSIDVNDGTDALTLISSSTGIAGPQLDFTFEKATPADNDVVGRINFNGRNSAAEGITYARIDGKSSQVLDGAETGVLSFSTRKNTSQFEEVLRINNTGEMIFPSGIEIYQATAGISNTIAIGTSAVQSQYPYQRIDSFSTDGSGYLWAFAAHDNSPENTAIKMLINDSPTVDEVTVIGALKVRDFDLNEYNSSYPTFTTTGVTLNSDGDIEATGDIKLPAGFHISRKGSLSSVSLITQRYVFTHNSNSVWGSCIIEYAVTGTLGASSTQNYRKGIITFTKYTGDATPMRNQVDTAIIAGSGISVSIVDVTANQFRIDFSISGSSGSRYIASTLDVTASEIVITDVAHSIF